eukprot:13224397-Alexandrium_andersonii.AAC.1
MTPDSAIVRLVFRHQARSYSRPAQRLASRGVPTATPQTAFHAQQQACNSAANLCEQFRAVPSSSEQFRA